MDTITDVRAYQSGNVWYVEFKRNGVLETTEPFGEEETATNYANFISNAS